MNARELLDLADHGRDTFVGIGPTYPWGGLYGGQIVAQALRAAALTVEADLRPHSLRAYFIRRGAHDEPVRYEVDRIRNGRSFCTRRVVARQAIGAILNLEASFHRAEPSAEVETRIMPAGLPGPTELTAESWSSMFDRAMVPTADLHVANTSSAGRSAAWMRVTEPFDDELLHSCMLAYLSDDLPTDAVVDAHPVGREPDLDRGRLFSASLDHTIWFHRPLRTDEWHLYEFACHSFVGGRGLTFGNVFAADGAHIATVAQEVLMRDGRRR